MVPRLDQVVVEVLVHPRVASVVEEVSEFIAEKEGGGNHIKVGQVVAYSGGDPNGHSCLFTVHSEGFAGRNADQSVGYVIHEASIFRLATKRRPFTLGGCEKSCSYFSAARDSIFCSFRFSKSSPT